MKEDTDFQLSIIVPVYNVEKYIRACMESIFKQGLDEKTFEVIIVNDGTQDRSMEVIQDFIEKHKNITVINQENQGLSMARNNGMAIARGEYILMPDSDDLLVENSVKPLLEKALETKADMVVADFLEMNDEEIKQYDNFQTLQKRTKPDFTVRTGEELLSGRFVVWKTLYRRAFINDNNISFYPGIAFEDVPFTCLCYLKANICIRTSWLLNIYRIGNPTLSSPSTFSMKKAHDLCISISKTWNLKKLKGLTPQTIQKLDNAIYSAFKQFLYKVIYITHGYNNKVSILKMLKHEVPDLRFTHGIKQKIHTYLFRNHPHVYITLMMIGNRIKKLY
ncbi:MAG: glycosyltransferase [Prevotella sp.]|nr:glycosyltransferase [Prevotella sp.]